MRARRSVDAVAGARRRSSDGVGVLEGELGAGVGVEGVALVEDRDDRPARRGVESGGVLERARGAVARVGEVDDDVGVEDGADGGAAHGVLERVLGIEEAGRVDEDHLGVAVGEEAEDAGARGLGLGADDGELLADEPVEEGGLAGVGGSGDGDEARVGKSWGSGLQGCGFRVPG